MPRTHLRRRRQTVFFRRIIPHDLRQRFGQREILRSLGHATPGEARRMAQRLWDGTETLFTLVRFNRSLTRADIARLAEQYLESESLKHDGLLATIGHYPELKDLPPSDSPASEHDVDDSSDPAPDAPKGTLNDPAEWLDLYEGRLNGLIRDRSLRVRHVVQDADTSIWYSNLTERTLELKAEASARWVLLHKNLLKLGLLEALVQGRGEHESLLPEGEEGSEQQDDLDDADNASCGSAFGKWFQRFESEYGVRNEVMFHSFRHTVTTLLCNVGVQQIFAEEVNGHESKERQSEIKRHNKGQTLMMLKDVIDRLVLRIDIGKVMAAVPSGKPRKAFQPVR